MIETLFEYGMIGSLIAQIITAYLIPIFLVLGSLFFLKGLFK